MEELLSERTDGDADFNRNLKAKHEECRVCESKLNVPWKMSWL